MTTEPKSLQEAVVYFSDPNNCIDYLAIRRWPDGRVLCPTCNSGKVKFNADRRLWQCSTHHPKRQFSIKVGTVMEDSAIPLDKWLVAMWLITNCKNGISSYEIAKDVKVTQKSAWFMLHRIRLAMQDEDSSKLGGDSSEVEADETFIGGSTRNMHKERKLRIDQERSKVPDWKAVNKNPYKTIVQGMLDRDARQIRAKVIPNVKRETLQNEILNNVEFGSKLYTDAGYSYTYNELASKYAHEVVNHQIEYVRGRVHTNGLENFWSLLKRTLHGTYHAVEPFHLGRYVDEQVFRYNNRGTKENKLTDSDRFDLIVRKLIGKRLTFAALTGKVGAAEAF
ncbi:MAG: IS1595 family transposase [Candidatus Sulfotelmatobacter sp.]